MSTMNEDLSFATWHSHRNLDDGMMGIFLGNPAQAENPAITATRARIITLNPGQVIFRWISSKANGTPEQKAAGSWWSTKRGAQAIMAISARNGQRDTSAGARQFSNIARSWGNDLRQVVCGAVVHPIRCFIGMGRSIYDKPLREVWKEGGLQLYIPNIAEKDASGNWTLSPQAKSNLQILWVKPSSSIDMNCWELARSQASSLVKLRQKVYSNNIIVPDNDQKESLSGTFLLCSRHSILFGRS
jgi:hypothetical protein